MGQYDTMQTCKKWGHIINSRSTAYPGSNQVFCDKCGSETVTKCKHCNTIIKGSYFDSWTTISTSPLFCHHCGKGYPWRFKRQTVNFFTWMISPIKYIIDAVINIFSKK